MPWVRKPMKDLVGWEKLRQDANNRYSRRCLNGETYPSGCSLVETASLGSEISQYQEERKS